MLLIIYVLRSIGAQIETNMINNFKNLSSGLKINFVNFRQRFEKKTVRGVKSEQSETTEPTLYPPTGPRGNSHLKMKGLVRDEGVGSTMRTIHRYDSHCLRGDDQCKAASFAFVNKAIFLQCDIFVFLNAPHSLLAHLGEG